MKNLIKYISLFIITLCISCVTASANNNANFQKGNEAEDRGNYKEALKWFRLGADQGDGMSAVRIGLIYQEGDGVPQNYEEAIKWYNLAIELGNSAASMLLTELSKTKGNGSKRVFPFLDCHPKSRAIFVSSTVAGSPKMFPSSWI